MWIGVVANTQGGLHPHALDALEGMDYILHCGNIGDPANLVALSNLAPVAGVIGKNDDASDFEPLTGVLFRQFQGVPFLVTHDVGTPAHPRAAFKEILTEMEPKVLLFGSTGQAFNDTIEERLWFNPGTCGPHTSRRASTVGIIELEGQSIRGEIVPLDA